MIENMADGEGKIAAQKEIAAAQDAMLNGKMGACGVASEQGDARAVRRSRLACKGPVGLRSAL